MLLGPCGSFASLIISWHIKRNTRRLLIRQLLPSQGFSKCLFDLSLLLIENFKSGLGQRFVDINFNAKTLVPRKCCIQREGGISTLYRFERLPISAIGISFCEGGIASLCSLYQSAPVFSPLPLRFLFIASGRLFRGLCPFAPVIWLCNNGKIRRERTVADPVKLYLHAKEGEFFGGRSIEEINRGTMFLAKTLGYPNDRVRLQPCRIGQQLAKMTMVGRCDLILDQNPSVGIRLLGKNIGIKRPNFFFDGLKLKRNTDFFGEKVEICFFR